MNRNHYVNRIDKVINYIQDNLQEKITVEAMAEISHFSKYHFARIFNSIVGMPPSAYLIKVRLNRSIKYLAESDKSILEISNLCGFETASNFNVAFKKRFNQTPSEIRKALKTNSNISIYVSNKQEEIESPPLYHGSSKNKFLRRIWEMNITIKELPNFEVGFVRHVGSYLDTYKAWDLLGAWAGQNGLFPPDQYFIGISIDDPETTEEYECRYDACVTIPPGFSRDTTQGIEFRTLPGGLYGLYSFYDTIDKLGLIYQSIFGQWLPNSEYDPDERHCLEFCMNNPSDDPEGKAKVDLYIPIKIRT
ncbi:GyrI-like domain-containing protein [Fontibacillus sp. BL9]|uniref:AraC family transcriptional regulator n=1 Tax=Fontibacillus sp. BL9 TaxID=3389971 RepID=UPI003979ECC6